MKKLLLIPAICLLCFSCNHDKECNNKACNNKPMKSQEQPSDWSITTKVKSAIMTDSSISASARFVSVNTTKGVVTLTGNVPTRADRQKIVHIVKRVHGVNRVNDKMTISKN